jgi:mRNA-degrading endonuclease RelE of RelBE toxin-antitoxin system
MVRETAREDLREIKLFHYRIIYKLDEKVRILTIHHAARLLTNNPNPKDFL